MKLFRQGSLGWFLEHELRISWRFLASMGGGKGRSIIITFAVIGLTALGLAATIGLALRSKGVHAPPLGDLPAIVVIIVDGVLLFTASLMMAQTVGVATMVFNDRGDLDLLLASPTPPWKILATRMLVIAFNSMLFFQILSLPLILTATAITEYWGLLAIPLVVSLLALVAAALGVAIAMGLFRILGPRRTRIVAQLIGVATGLSIVVMTRLIRGSGGKGLRPLGPWLHDSGLEPAARWMARAATGSPVELISLAAGAIGIFALVTVLLGRRFAANASIAAGEAQPARANTRRAPSTFKTRGLRKIMVIKELKLLWRDPSLISQVLLQILYLPFVMFITLSGRGGSQFFTHVTYAICAGAMAYVAGQLAAGFGWLTISAEEAPDLLTCAPVTSDQVARAKVTAVVLPVACLLSVLSIGLAFLSPWAGLMAFVGSCVCAAVIAYIELWMQRPGKRSSFRMRRRGSGSPWVAILEAVICMLFGSVTGMAAAGTAWAILPALLLVAVVAIVASLNKDKWLTGDA